MLEYLFIKKIIMNFTEFFEMSVFFGQNKLSKFVIFFLPIYWYAVIFQYAHLYPLHNEPPVGWKLREE